MFRPSGTKFSKMPLQLNEFESVIYNHVYRIDNSNAFFRNSENEHLYQNFRCQGISYVIILVEKPAGIIIVKCSIKL